MEISKPMLKVALTRAWNQELTPNEIIDKLDVHL